MEKAYMTGSTLRWLGTITLMKKSKKQINGNGHGGIRPGSGRPPLPESKRRKNVTVKLLDKTAKQFTKLAKQAKVSKGGVIEYMVEAPEAAQFREHLIQGK